MNLNDVDFSNFPGRDEGLKAIGRWRIYKPMFYRPSDYFHSRKLFCMLQDVLPKLRGKLPEDIDEERTLVMALVHDDAEIVMGDVQASLRLRMSKEELADVDNQERQAIDELAKRFPNEIHGYNYKALLTEIFERNTFASQLVKYIDHFDAYCEALHELYAGNQVFATHYVAGHDSLPLAIEIYPDRFNKYRENYPLLHPIIGKCLPFLKQYEQVDAEIIAKSGTLHTKSTLQEKTGEDVYDWWKEAIISIMKTEAIDELITVKER